MKFKRFLPLIGNEISTASLDGRVRANGVHATLPDVFLGTATDDGILSSARREHVNE